jgi:hypothetical protein
MSIQFGADLAEYLDIFICLVVDGLKGSESVNGLDIKIPVGVDRHLIFIGVDIRLPEILVDQTQCHFCIPLYEEKDLFPFPY